MPSNFLEEVPDDVEVYLSDAPARRPQDTPARSKARRVSSLPGVSSAPAPPPTLSRVVSASWARSTHLSVSSPPLPSHGAVLNLLTSDPYIYFTKRDIFHSNRLPLLTRGPPA